MVENILNAMEDSIRTRHVAAETLAKVADAGSTGNWPSGVTCEQLGEALERIMLNAPGSDPLAELVQSYNAAQKKRRESLSINQTQDAEEDFDDLEDLGEEDECPFDAYDDWDDYVDDGHDFSGQ